MSVSDIEQELREIYGYRLSTSAISIITDKVKHVLDWQNRPLDPVYCIVWMDGIVLKVRQACKVINKTIYLAVGLNCEGYKKIIRNVAWTVGDILVTLTDNLNGFTQAFTQNFG